jgi:hypothetical protein
MERWPLADGACPSTGTVRWRTSPKGGMEPWSGQSPTFVSGARSTHSARWRPRWSERGRASPSVDVSSPPFVSAERARGAGPHGGADAADSEGQIPAHPHRAVRALEARRRVILRTNPVSTRARRRRLATAARPAPIVGPSSPAWLSVVPTRPSASTTCESPAGAPPRGRVSSRGTVLPPRSPPLIPR